MFKHLIGWIISSGVRETFQSVWTETDNHTLLKTITLVVHFFCTGAGPRTTTTSILRKPHSHAKLRFRRMNRYTYTAIWSIFFTHTIVTLDFIFIRLMSTKGTHQYKVDLDGFILFCCILCFFFFNSTQYRINVDNSSLFSRDNYTYSGMRKLQKLLL